MLQKQGLFFSKEFLYTSVTLHERSEVERVFSSSTVRKLDLNLMKKLVKCGIWSIALYGAQT
jgi:hypothetical protein